MTEINRRTLLGGAAAFGALPTWQARAQAQNTIRIGVLNDQSGLYRDTTGPGSVACARQAVADFGAQARGINVEIIAGDHQNRPDVGSNIARQWIDRDGVDVILDVPTSSVALAINTVTREKNKVFINSGAATSDLTGSQCSPNTIHWTYDTYMLAKSTGGAMVRAGGDSWFFLTADYAFGHALERDTSNFVRAAGGRVLGGARTPFPSTDFSSFLVQAQASRAKVIGLANAGGDTINAIKQAAEFGLTRRGVKLAALLMFISDVHSLGLETAQGLVCTETFYWDLNDQTRRFTQRVLPQMPGQFRPTMNQAGCYSAVMHYLKTVADMGVAQAKASGVETVNRMKARPTEDEAMGQGTIRADGRRTQPSYLFEVKSPRESRGAWDYYKLLQTTPAEEAFRPIADGGCALVRS